VEKRQQRQQRVTAIAMSRGVIRLKCDRFIEVIDGGFNVRQFQRHVSPVAVGRHNADRLVKAHHRFTGSTQIHQHGAAVMMRLCMAGSERDHGVAALKRVVE
jgi:hypothetical protein